MFIKETACEHEPKENTLLGIITWSVLGKQNRQAKKICSNKKEIDTCKFIYTVCDWRAKQNKTQYNTNNIIIEEILLLRYWRETRFNPFFLISGLLELTKVYYEYTLELVFKRRILINASLGKWKIVLRRTRAQITVEHLCYSSLVSKHLVSAGMGGSQRKIRQLTYWS